jgi:site-specific DNA-methyltransferase (adenine-specific)
MQQTNQGHTAAVNSNPNPNPRFKILPGNALFELQSVKAESIDTVFTSPEPPYNYQQLEELEQILLQLPRVVKQTGSIWVNMGDVHNDDGVLALIPQRLVYDMVVEHGWQLRSEIIWHRPYHYHLTTKPIEQPDARRFRKEHEFVYWFVKDVKQYYFDPILESLNNKSDVITAPYREPEPGVFESGFPDDLIWRTAINTTPEHGRILDPFCGTGTTGVVALEAGREFLGIEANPLLIEKINNRLSLTIQEK